MFGLFRHLKGVTGVVSSQVGNENEWFPCSLLLVVQGYVVRFDFGHGTCPQLRFVARPEPYYMMHDDAQPHGADASRVEPVPRTLARCRTFCLPCGATSRIRGNRYATARFAALLITQASSGLASARMERTLMPNRNAP